MLGLHSVTVPLPCPASTTPLFGFWHSASHLTSRVSVACGAQQHTQGRFKAQGNRRKVAAHAPSEPRAVLRDYGTGRRVLVSQHASLAYGNEQKEATQKLERRDVLMLAQAVHLQTTLVVDVHIPVAAYRRRAAHASQLSLRCRKLAERSVCDNALLLRSGKEVRVVQESHGAHRLPHLRAVVSVFEAATGWRRGGSSLHAHTCSSVVSRGRDQSTSARWPLRPPISRCRPLGV